MPLVFLSAVRWDSLGREEKGGIIGNSSLLEGDIFAQRLLRIRVAGGGSARGPSLRKNDAMSE